MLFKTISASVYGIDAYPVEVEVDVGSAFMKDFNVVGLPDNAVKESRERIKSALRNCGFEFPYGQGVTINLAPADLRKEGSGFDLPMALGVVGCQGQLFGKMLDHMMFLGELSLDGSVRAVRGALRVSNLPHESAIRRVFDNSQLIERFDKWLLICGKAANTRISYVSAAKQFAKFLQDKPLTAATRNDVVAFIGSLYARNFAPATLQNRLDCLRVLFDCLQLGSQVRVSVPRYIPRRKLPRRLPNVLSEKEMGNLIKAARSPRDLAIIELGYASGLRVSELAKLRVEDLHLNGRSLIVREGKGGNDRIAFLGRPGAAALRAYLGDRVSGPVFLQEPRCQRGGVTRGKRGDWWGQWRENGKTQNVRLGDFDIPDKDRARAAMDAFLKYKLPVKKTGSRGLTSRNIHRVVVKTAKRAGISGVHPHTLRHSIATHCLNHGMDVRHVQELLGDASAGTTAGYLHVATASLKNTHDKFFPKR